MSRYCGAVCRFCRREGEKLFLKGERCYTSKCAIERREGGPGQHGKARQSTSDYKIQLREKQKTKRIYGVVEKQFRRYYEEAANAKGVTGSLLLLSLERRIDNIVYRLGFASSRRQARQFVGHGLVRLNGRKISVPSQRVKAGDQIEVAEVKKSNVMIQASMASAVSRIIPEWLELHKNETKGVVKALPTREQLSQSVNEQLIVELYSR